MLQHWHEIRPPLTVDLNVAPPLHVDVHIDAGQPQVKVDGAVGPLARPVRVVHRADFVADGHANGGHQAAVERRAQRRWRGEDGGAPALQALRTQAVEPLQRRRRSAQRQEERADTRTRSDTHEAVEAAGKRIPRASSLLPRGSSSRRAAPGGRSRAVRLASAKSSHRASGLAQGRSRGRGCSCSCRTMGTRPAAAGTSVSAGSPALQPLRRRELRLRRRTRPRPRNAAFPTVDRAAGADSG